MNPAQSLESASTAQAHAPATWRSRAEQAYEIALPFVFLVLALLLFPSRLTPLGMLGVLALCALRWAARGSPIPALTLNPFLLALLVMFAFGLYTSPAPDIAWMRAGHVLAGVLVLFTVADRADSEAHLVIAAGGVVLVAVLFALGSPFAAAWLGTDNSNLAAFATHYLPVLARQSNVNSIAGALEAAVPLAFALIAVKQKPWRLIGALALVPLLGMLLVLQSRGAWLAVLLGMVVYATLYRRWVLPLVPLVLLAGLWLNANFGEPLPAQLLGGGSSESVLTLGDRTEIWREGIRVLSTAPLTGVGVDGFSVLGKTVLGTGDLQYTFDNTHAHNMFIEVGLDTGITGLAAFIGMLGVAIVAAWRVYRARTDALLHALAIGVLAAFVVILTHGMFDLIYWGFKGGIFLWATVGLALALQRIQKRLEIGDSSDSVGAFN